PPPTIDSWYCPPALINCWSMIWELMAPAGIFFFKALVKLLNARVNSSWFVCRSRFTFSMIGIVRKLIKDSRKSVIVML
ncbi:hypothetical protein L2474_08645, partial [Lactobacillus gasseri]|nr:hypothetical protein [Lactobacillus gasseri]MCZ3828621.1 hypothetical protein [Lactobacillus gasseri]